VELYQRAKLTRGAKGEDGGIKTVNKIHSILGSSELKWVFGIINQLEDGHYYLEDSTYQVQLSFAELKYVEPDAFFTEMCVIMAEGRHDNGMFYLH